MLLKISNKTFFLLAKTLFAVILFWFLFTKVDIHNVLQRISQVNTKLFLLTQFIIVLQFATAAFRWKLILAGLKTIVAYINILSLFYIGVFFNTCLPGAIGGDIIRAYMIRKIANSLYHAAASVMLESVFGVLSLIALILAFYPFFKQFVAVELILAFSVCLLCAAVGTLLFLTPVFLKITKFISLQNKLLQKVLNLRTHLQRLLSQKYLVLQIFIASTLIFVFESIIIFNLAKGLNIVNINLAYCFMLVPPVVLANSLPISIGGWGVREATLVVALGILSVPMESAMALSIVLGIAKMLASLPGGLVWLAHGYYNKNQEIIAETSALLKT